MNSVRALRSKDTYPILMVDELEHIDTLCDQRIEAVIWHRQLPLSVLDSMRSLPTHAVSDQRFCIPANKVSDYICATFDEWKFSESETTNWIAADVQTLAFQMAKLLSCTHLLVRMELVRDDACRKFHQDKVKARLICTYHGAGTELGIVGEDGLATECQTVPTGSPILLKGKLWPGTSHKSVLHRSPPIESAGESRLVIVLNESTPNTR